MSKEVGAVVGSVLGLVVILGLTMFNLLILRYRHKRVQQPVRQAKGFTKPELPADGIAEVPTTEVEPHELQNDIEQQIHEAPGVIHHEVVGDLPIHEMSAATSKTTED